MSSPVQPVPEGFHTITPHLVVRDASAAIEFYKKAFGVREVMRLPGPDGKSVGHAEIQIGNSRFMLCDEYPGSDYFKAPASLEGTAVVIHLYVEDADGLFERAVEAGARVAMPLMDTFWGDRYGKLADPFGHEWSVATRLKDLTPEEIQKGAAEFLAKHETCGS